MDELDALGPVRRLPEDIVAGQLQDQAEAVTNERLVVHDDHTRHGRTGSWALGIRALTTKRPKPSGSARNQPSSNRARSVIATSPGPPDRAGAVPEPAELTVQAGDGLRGWLGVSHFFSVFDPHPTRQLEPLDFPAGLRVVGAGVVEPDAEATELDLEGDPATTPGQTGEEGTFVG